MLMTVCAVIPQVCIALARNDIQNQITVCLDFSSGVCSDVKKLFRQADGSFRHCLAPVKKFAIFPSFLFPSILVHFYITE